MIENEKLTKEEYIKQNFNKKFKFINDSCFKYVMKDVNLVKEIISCFDSKVYERNFEVISEAGAGTFQVSFGEMRVDIQILNNMDIYSFEAQNYKRDNIDYLSFKKFLMLIVNDMSERRTQIEGIDDLKKNYLIVFDNCNQPNKVRTFEEISTHIRNDENQDSIYYDGKVIILYLKNIIKNDKIKLEIGDNPEKLKKLLLCFNKSGEELLKEEDSFMNEIGKKVVEFNDSVYDRIAALESEYLEMKQKKAEKIIKEKDEEIAQKNAALAQNKEEITQKDEALARNKEEIAQKNEVITQKDESLIKSAIALKHAGLSNEEIANITNLSIEDIKNLK